MKKAASLMMRPLYLICPSSHTACNARPLQDSETIASTDDEILESLIDTFPASDPPAWVALARVGIPKRNPTSRRARKPPHL
ncbi:hypothetical protein [Bradyrhizobium erythrophlei]|uniref:hypothetical protein n=1 Tax=Bradyrhizobium erythrophlei TaxID=1437360 RepID=UPI0012ECB4FD|nr:hypothetical protein [Bradyrhizobium erythrophlei]